MWLERNGRTWRIRDEVAGRKVDLAKGYPTKDSARAAMVLLKADALRGDALVPQAGRITLDEFVDTWWPSYSRRLKPTAVKSEGDRLDCHIRPLLGHLSFDELDSAAVQTWVDMLSDGVGPFRPGSKRKRKPLAPKSVANCHGLLFVIMRAAVQRRLIRVNPCVGTSLPERVHHEMKFLSDPEIGRLLAAVPEHWRPLVLLLVGTGLRWGEAIGLKAGRVDLLAAKPRLIVVEQLQEMQHEMVWQTPKSERSRRTVSFTRNVALALAPLVAGKGPDEVVFTAPWGGLVRTRNFRRGWLQWTAAAGLEGLRVHDLRHTHAAILISANRPLSAISRRLGHSSIQVTDTLYGHIREEADDGILDALDRALPRDLTAEVAAELAGI